ncbi:MAG TPA: hypothetical protein VMG12_45425 [Polyangiaceae bacterium]|nr:hypothetical protein [Polyangiaceae bacterium]
MPFPPMGPQRWRHASAAIQTLSSVPWQIAARARRVVIWGSALLGLGACALGAKFGDLGAQLLDPDVQGIDAPGKRWVAGPHFDLNILSDQSGKRYAAARNEASELLLIDFEEEHYCRAGKIARYTDAVRARSRQSLVPLLTEREVGDGEAPELRLTFTDFECQRSPFSVPVSGLPNRVVEGLPSGSGTSLLVRTPAGGLALVDPWEQTTKPLAESVRPDDPVLALGYFLWVDRGVIVISDEELEPIAFVGRDVVAVSASPEDAELAYIEAGSGPGGTLYTVDARGTQEPVEVASDACNIRYLTLNGRRHLSYFSPCAERQLVLRDVADDSVRVIDANVAGPPSVRNLSGQSVLTYVTTETNDAVAGTLWVLNPDQEKVAVAENTRVGPSTVTGDGGLLTVLDWASNGGRLVEWKPDALTEVAQGVIELGPLGRLDNNDLTLLGNFDGVTGDLLRLRADLSTELLAEGVPTRAANADAFLANFEGESGDLMLLDRSDGSSQPLGAGVGRGAFIFTQQFRAVLMLAARDPETRTNTLRMHLLRAERDYVLHDGVTEAREVAFPAPGVLYNVVTGDDAGVWFAKTL